MDRAEIDRLVQRLVENPHDEEALAYAHSAGEADPKSYAMFLERVGTETRDRAYAAHWLAEAANVWSTTLGDAHRAARILMMALEKDPTAQVAADRLAQLYRDKGDSKALVALLDRRAKALAPLAGTQPEIRGELAGLHEELARLWSEPPLTQPKKAIENYKKSIELDPTSAYAIYNARELYKQLQQWQDAIPLYGAELELEQDPQRRVGLLRDEAATRKLAGDLQGATRALAQARDIDGSDPALQQEYASSVLDRIQAGEAVPADERTYAAELLVALSETYEGEHGLAYAGAALDIEPGHDRAVQLLIHYSQSLGAPPDMPQRCNAYLSANPNGALVPEVRAALAAAGGSVADPPSDPSINQTAERAAASDDGPATGDAPPRRASMAPPKASPATRTPERDEEPPESEVETNYRAARSGGSDRGLSPDKMQGILDAAQMLAGKGKKPEAFAKYKEVLESDPAHPEALSWTEDYLRSKRDYGQLRDVLLASIRASANTPELLETRKERLREVAGLCEGNLRDVDGAISSWRQLLSLDRKDESARTALMRLLEKSQRWDELANVLEQEATIESDVETKVFLEKKLAKLQEDKRKDLVAAGEAWGRIARLTTDDDQAVLTASKLFEKGERADLAAQVLSEGAAALEDPVARGSLMQRLGELREQLGEAIAAGDSYAEAADALRNGKLWDEADRLYSGGEAWEKAANAAYQRGLLTGDLKQQAACYARAADYLSRANREDEALERLEEATEFDPLNDDYANLLVARYNQADSTDKLVSFLTKRGDRLTDRSKRINIRREAATLCASRLQDKELARELWLKLLEDGDDREALERLIDDAVEREDHTEAATLLRRLGQNTVDKAEKARVALREAELLADGVGDIDTAISRYELILSDLDPTCRPALQAIADLQENRGSLAEASDALERELKLVADVQERGQIAARLARLYEKLEDPRNAIRALDLVRKADLEDFDALTRLCELCEITEQWGRVAELLVERIEIEADEQEIVELTTKLAAILADKLDRGDEALGALTDLADQGDASVRHAYIELGDKLGWKGIVASKLKEWWFDARHGTERTAALRGAFERFADVGRDADAVTVAIELVRTKGADKRLAEHLEELSVKTGDQDALAVAHDVLTREVQGPDRAHELVRQAEVRARAGLARQDAMAHGEQGLVFIAPSDAEPLLERLAQLAAKPVDVIDLYERQVTRSKAPPDRVRALARAAQIASTRGQPERARGFFELALSGAPTDETIAVLETAAREGDKFGGGDRLRRALCHALSQGGHGARDGGRTRANLLRRAATLAHRDLNDAEQAFTWLGDALVAHVDGLTLDMLEALGIDTGDPRRAEAALSHALSEVFDGPLVRQLLARRAKIRRDQLVEPVNAAADLKKLHDLSPTDQAVMDELAGLFMELNDYKSLVQLYEDQILRGKDMNARAELARKVARIWEEQLADGREAADAWRRVLRMRAGDTEATQGLERSKTNQLKKPEGDPKFVYAPPKLVSDQPVPPPARGSSPKGASAPPSAAAPAAGTPPKRPSSANISSPPSSASGAATAIRGPLPPQVPQSASEVTSTGETATTARPVTSPRSTPPPLPKRNGEASPARAPQPGEETVATTIRGLGKGGSLESEIDESLDRLELEGPTGTSLPEGIAALPLEETAVTRALSNDAPSPPKRPADLAFAASADEVTESGQVVPHTLREMRQLGDGPKTELSAGATERPMHPTDASALSGESEGLRVAPLTIPGGPETVDAAPATAGDALESGDIMDVEDPTGADMRVDLETTHVGPEDDEIVIADDLAEDADDVDEHTQTGAVAPPYSEET
ncbi:MAG: tetratricopeptide repeat protein [Labilithrix sp.]|nr:tetratricopeptide repeat protein [Labilithrix sp.]